MNTEMSISCNSAAQPLEVPMASSLSSAGIVAKFATIAGGTWIEENPTPYGTTRVWRFNAKGNAEWACLEEAKTGFARWYGSQFMFEDFILC